MGKHNSVSFALKVGLVMLGVTSLLAGTSVHAGARDQAKRMYDRIAGVPPTAIQLEAMLDIMDVNRDNVTDSEALAIQAAELAFDSPSFYNVTLKNMVTPWTNEEQTQFSDLNDFTATVIGLVRDGGDFREVLYGDVIYVGADSTLTPYSVAGNQHYIDLEASGADLGDSAVLRREAQSSVTGLPAAATAGVMTTRAAAHAFFVAGTNRAMFRFTLMNFMCNDLEQVKDISRSPDRVRQDVSRSPGGDSRIFMNSCVGCHAGMDPMAQAFAYYEWSGEEGSAEGQLQYTPGQVQGKYRINADNFRYGYVTPDDRWDNYWREGQNAVLGWDNAINYGVSGCSSGSCRGAKTLGMELAHSDAFAECKVKQVFETVCLHEPATSHDHSQVSSMVSAFQGNNYNLKGVFSESAAYCRGD
ncbi:MAG: hypothetical protein D6160_11720 [Ketobacter sp.]|nr:MAG: hypothetical protein D6160_11720 [Ketobacter sp.]